MSILLKKIFWRTIINSFLKSPSIGIVTPFDSATFNFQTTKVLISDHFHRIFFFSYPKSKHTLYERGICLLTFIQWSLGFGKLYPERLFIYPENQDFSMTRQRNLRESSNVQVFSKLFCFDKCYTIFIHFC